MELTEYLSGTWRYLKQTSFNGSIHRPELKLGQVTADLHAHACIANIRDLRDTLDVLVEHNVGVFPIVTHGTGSAHDMNYWQVKDLVQASEKTQPFEFEDRGLAFDILHKGRRITHVPGYETWCFVDGIRGAVDVLALMPDKGFEDEARSGISFTEYLAMGRHHNAIVIAAHPFTICERGRTPRFAVANAKEREVMGRKVLWEVDGVDVVGANCFWFICSNELLLKEYEGRPLANSDAHGTSHYTRQEIGRSGNIFDLGNWETGVELREMLRSRIRQEDFVPFLNYMSPPRFGACAIDVLRHS
jgi:hypothetical protein